MKQFNKPLITILALLLSLSLSACGGGGNNASGSASPQPPSSSESTDSSTTDEATPTQNTPTADNEPTDNNISETLGNLFDWTEAGTYYYEVETTSAHGDSISHYRDVHAKDGEDYASITVEKEADGSVMRQIHTFKKDGKIIIINDLEKTYAEMPPEFMALSEGIQDAFGDMNKVDEGTGEIDGKSLPYEEYDTNGITTKYFFDNGQVYGYTSELVFGDTKIVTVSIITKQSNRIPSELFQIPEGYTKIEP